VLQSFLEALGNDGTLLLPLFNFDFADGKPFDISETPSQMGVLTEAGRNWPGAVRTGHPIYSFAAIGRNAGRFRNICNFSGYGADSPFAILREIDGLIGVLDLEDQNSMTYYHHVEETLEVPYRYHKQFTGLYCGSDGIEKERTFGLFVRDLEAGVTTRVNPIGERLWTMGLYRGDRPGKGSGLRTISARMMFDAVADVIRAGQAEGMLYAIEKRS
jgi:aminoglycoside 3-N-acetyltransferase